jgi:hypothetical protein
MNPGAKHGRSANASPATVSGRSPVAQKERPATATTEEEALFTRTKENAKKVSSTAALDFLRKGVKQYPKQSYPNPVQNPEKIDTFTWNLVEQYAQLAQGQLYAEMRPPQLSVTERMTIKNWGTRKVLTSISKICTALPSICPSTYGYMATSGLLHVVNMMENAAYEERGTMLKVKERVDDFGETFGFADVTIRGGGYATGGTSISYRDMVRFVRSGSAFDGKLNDLVVYAGIAVSRMHTDPEDPNIVVISSTVWADYRKNGDSTMLKKYWGYGSQAMNIVVVNKNDHWFIFVVWGRYGLWAVLDSAFERDDNDADVKGLLKFVKSDPTGPCVAKMDRVKFNVEKQPNTSDYGMHAVRNTATAISAFYQKCAGEGLQEWLNLQHPVDAYTRFTFVDQIIKHALAEPKNRAKFDLSSPKSKPGTPIPEKLGPKSPISTDLPAIAAASIEAMKGIQFDGEMK